MGSGASVELPLEPVAAEVFEAVGTQVRTDAEAAAARWLNDMVDGSWLFDWAWRGTTAVVAEPHPELPCVVFSGARQFCGWWVPTLFLMAGHRDTTRYWQWATCAERLAPKVGDEAIEGIEWVIDMLMCVAESPVRTLPE